MNVIDENSDMPRSKTPHFHEVITRSKLLSEGQHTYMYEMLVTLRTSGTQSFHWVGKNGETFVASVKVRQELDPLYRDPVWLAENYLEKERSMADIADQFGITPTAVNQWLNKHDIPTRKRGRNTDDN
mgnify:CR=1 FL=1